jgi:hypothetical protein
MSSLAIGTWLVGLALIIYSEFHIGQSPIVRFMIFIHCSGICEGSTEVRVFGPSNFFGIV